MSLERGWAPRPPQDEAEDGDGAPRAPPPPWLPSHVQVTVVQARGLRAKGGPGDAFVALQLGRQKHRTSVATQKGGCPRWAEECALEVPPPPAPHAGPDPEALLLQVTVWQRALVGADRFLGRAAVPLAALLEGGRSHQDQWYKLHSKPGKKEKDRGEVQLSIQFTRHSLTASMFDLSVKEKPRSPFGRLKDKVTGRQKYDLESASAIVPSSSGALDEDFGSAGKKAKAKGFFFRSKLRKSSLTQSNTSLGSDSTASSASSVAGSSIGAPGGMPQSPSRHSSLSTDRSARDFLPSPKLTHKRAFSDEASQIGLLPDARRAQGLTPQSEPVSRSSLCINGSHIYCEEPAPKPAGLPLAQSSAHRPSQGSVPGPCVPEPDLPPWPGSSAGGFQKGPPRDPPRFIPSPPILAAQEEDKLSVKTIALNRQRGWAKAAEGPGAQSRPVQIAAPLVFSAEVRRVRPRGGSHEEEEDEARRGGAGSLHRASGRDSRESGGAAHEGPTEGQREEAAGEEEGRAGSGLRPGSPDSEEPAWVPSSPPGLLALTESGADAPCPEDRGPCPSVQAGERPAGPAPRRPSRPEAPARAPPEWDDSFDAFASSRLRPDTPREPPAPPPAAALAEDPAPRDGPWDPGPAEAAAQPQGSGGVARTGEEPRPGSPHPPNSLPEGGQSPPGDAPLPAGAAPESTATQGRPTWAQHPGEEQAHWGPCGEAAGAWAAEPGQSLERGAAATPAALGWAQEDRRGRRASPLLEDAFSLEEPGLPAEAPGRNELGGAREGPSLPGSGQGPGGEVGEEAERLGLPPPTGGPHMGTGPSQALEGSPRHEGQDAEEEGPVASEAGEPSGMGAHSTGGPPPKPPRRFTPLSLEEDAGEALGWLGGTSGREVQEALGLEEPPLGSPGEEAPSPAAPASAALTAIIGAGGGRPWRATEGLRLATEDDTPAEANELRSPELPPGDTGLSAGKGAPGAEQFGTCPSELSSGPPGPPSAREECGRPQGTETSATLLVLGSLQAAEGGPEPQAGGPWPCAAPWEPQPGATELFWAAAEELPPLPSPDCSGLPAAASRGPGTEGPEIPLGQPSPARPWVLAGGMLQPGGETELSSAWSDDRVEDYKRADFWQAGSEMWGARQEAAPAPGNPFAPHPGSPLQSNPFVERAPGVSPIQPAAHQQEEQGCRDHRAERALRGLFPELPPAAPSPHGSQPLASSTPFLQAAACPKPFAFTPPAAPPAPGGASVGSSPAVAWPSLAQPLSGTEASAPSVLPAESQLAEEVPPKLRASPHPVKPLSSSVSGQERPQHTTPDRSGGSQETRTPSATTRSRDSASPTWQLGRLEAKKEPSVLDPSAKYFHLTHDELIQLLSKREAELRRKQEHIQELENYIDRLLVRIMEQSPTLLQIPLGGEAKAAK